MDESTPLTFEVIITIVLPDSDKPGVLVVTLTSADPLTMQDGRLKTLQDCTLAELQEFAAAIEADVWQQYQDATLLDLAVEDQVEISFTIVGANDLDQTSERLWLEHTVIFPEKADTTKSDIEIAAGPPSEMLSDSEQSPIPLQEAKTEEELASPLRRLDEGVQIPDADQSELTSNGLKPQVIVAEPEQIHKEREISDVETPVKDFKRPEYPRIRILGKRRPQNHPTWTAVDILMNEPAFRDAQAHALSQRDREVAGVLIGPPPEKQPDGRYIVHVSDTIIAKHTRMLGASVTYTPESWRYVNDKLAELYPDEAAVIVGWYHTHPGFGIFLSGMDRFIHHNFFTQLWHIALVLDPTARRSGFFCWDRNQTRVDAYEFPWPEWASSSW